MRSILASRPSTAEAITIADMEAGLEHLSRSTPRASDVLLVIAEPYFRSLETAQRVKTMALELGIPRVYAVANKIRGERDAEAVRAFCDRRQLAVLATIPYDEAVIEASQIPAAPLDHAPRAAGIAAVADLATKLTAPRPN